MSCVGGSLVRLWRLCRTPHVVKLIRYATVSAISALVSLLVLTLVYGVLRLWSAVPSTLFANIVAGFPSYYLNRQWVWGKTGRSHLWREVLPFWTLSIAGIALSIVTAALARDFGQRHHLEHLVFTAVVVGANIAAFGLLWVLKFLIFNRIFIHHPVAQAKVEA